MTDRSIFHTETAANLLEKQGYRMKAADVYLDLLSRHPEKRIFYTAKIESLGDDLAWVKKNQHLVDLLHMWVKSINRKNLLDSLKRARLGLIEKNVR